MRNAFVGFINMLEDDFAVTETRMAWTPAIKPGNGSR